MSDQILSHVYHKYKFSLEEFLKTLHQFTIDTNASAFQQIVSNLRSNINEPFLFVVVGEVKSGKSSFINALLGEDICKVDAAPCTDVVQELVYADEKTEVNLSPHLRRIGLPADILKTIAIVDTPGTNTIIKHHHEITQKFIPNGDLVLFIFPAKNPHTQSSWDLLDYVSEEWRKRVVFILQQADLARPEELTTNIEKVKEYAIKRNISSPKIFSASAEWEKNGDERSGFEDIRRFIRETITGGRHFQLKLQSILDTAGSVIAKVDDSMVQRKNQFEGDKLIVEKVKARLATGEQQSTYEIKSLINRLVNNYERISDEVKIEFTEGLSLAVLFKKSFNAIFNKDQSMTNWIKELQKRFERRLNTTFEEIASDGAQHFLEGIRQLLQGLLEELNRIKSGQKGNEELYIRIGQRRQEVIDDVRRKVAELLEHNSFIYSLKSGPGRIAPTIMGGGVLAIIGTIILTATHGAFFDITGGLLTSTGLLLAGGMLLFKKGKIIRDFERGLDESKKQFESELNERLTTKLKIVYEDIDRSFIEFYEYVHQEEERLIPLLDQFQEIQEDCSRLRNMVNSISDESVGEAK